MARWRDTKKGNVESKTQNINEKEEVIRGLCTSPLHRVKAFVTDMFMIMMPIMYITTYIIMDGAESFQGSQTARWLTMGIYGLITVVFWVKTGQTPGFKAYDLKIIDDNTGKIPTFGLAIARYVVFIISAVTIVGFLLSFFRKDKKTLQDVLMQTSVVRLEERIQTK
ncbi:MAG: RDD family protein [Campylobacterota bacterium]|nr:RDD family protein [Campylobacterota bacterium]